MIKTKIGKTKLMLMALALSSVIILPISAYMYSTRQDVPTGIMIKTPTVQIGLYWDAGCTDPITVIDFGAIPQPNENTTMDKLIYIKNEGDVPLTLYWNSTLNSITNEITEEWLYNSEPWNGTWVLAPGAWNGFTYYIHIPQYVTIATYNWTLTVWGIY